MSRSLKNTTNNFNRPKQSFAKASLCFRRKEAKKRATTTGEPTGKLFKCAFFICLFFQLSHQSNHTSHKCNCQIYYSVLNLPTAILYLHRIWQSFALRCCICIIKASHH
uniref:Uncharacterized protein n=1 Tax=Halimeda micronesica TaxID=170426 RepID=A0A386AXF0_9CHLO|nr:hypothetical protein [Halimeda micronesica]